MTPIEGQFSQLLAVVRSAIRAMREVAREAEADDAPWSEHVLAVLDRDFRALDQDLRDLKAGRYLLDVRQFSTNAAQLLASAPPGVEYLRSLASDEVEKVAQSRLETSKALGLTRLTEDAAALDEGDKALRAILSEEQLTSTPTGGLPRKRDTQPRRKPGRTRTRAQKPQYVERVVTINRVATSEKGGRRFSFTALVVVGDGDGTVGVGYGKAKEVPAAIAKGVEEAKKQFFKVPRIQGTIPHPVQGEAAAGVVMLRPASPGTGVIAGGPVRAVLECAGVHDVLSKSLGSDNAINIVHATVAALKGLERPEAAAARHGFPIENDADAGEAAHVSRVR